MKKLLYLVIVLFLISGCKKDKTPSPDETVVASGVNVIPEQTWNSSFVSIDTTHYTIILSDNSAKVKAGDIIVSSEGEGLLRKVSLVTNTSDGKVEVRTETSYLTDLIKQGVIEFEQPLTVSMIDKVDYNYSGIKLNTVDTKGADQMQFNWDINTVLFDLDKNLTTTADQIRIEGNLNCDWKVAARIDIGWFAGLKEVKFGFESSQNLNLDLIAGLQYSSEKKFTLATINFSPITVMAGAVPVVFTPQMKVVAGINGYANASVTTGIEQAMSFNAGLQYLRDKGWAPFQEFNKNLTFNPPVLNMNAGAEVYVKPEFSVKIYGVAGPYASLKLYSRIEADLLQTPWWKLYGGLNMNAGVKVDILDKFLLEYNVSDLLDYETVLSEASAPPLTAPDVTTAAIANVTAITAAGGGNVTADGGATVTVKGVCWSTSQNPTVSNSRTTDGTGSGSFTSSIAGLNPNTTYYVRAYATNSIGTSYGSQISFTTNQVITTPVVTTNQASNVTSYSSSSGGDVTSDGNAFITARGICWGTSQNPSISGNKTTDGTGTGAFTSSLTGLNANTIYYVRAYATNSAGTSYGQQVTFTTSPIITAPVVTTSTPLNVTFNSALAGGEVTDDGNSAVTARGICWNTSQDPTISGSKTNDGTGTGTFTSSISGLNPNTTYYVRAYATNNAGTSYGSQVTFTTPLNITAPVVNTSAVTGITSNTASSGGEVTDDGNAAVTARGICWNTSQNPSISGNKTIDGTGTGTFSSNLTGLNGNTTYYVRAYATNSAGTSYGTEVTFTTGQNISSPVVTTNPVSSITTSSATAGGEVTADGGATVTARGICWNTTPNPTTSRSKSINGTGSGAFTSGITGLIPNTTYYVRAYATNIAGTSYGPEVSFTTNPVINLPFVNTGAITSVTTNSAASGGEVTSSGGAEVTARGICWSTSQNPTTNSNKTTDGTGTGQFTSSMYGLSGNTTYYVRAYATNSAGTNYGTQLSFKTVSDAPYFIFTKTVSGYQQVYSANIDFTVISQLTSGTANNDQPRVSPDGTKIVYTSGSGSAWDIWYMNIDGTNKTRVTTTNVNNLFPYWHNNGNDIIYENNSGGARIVIHKVGANGTHDVIYIDTDNKNRWPAMNPANANEVVYGSYSGTSSLNSELRVYNVTAGTYSILVPADGYSKNSPGYSHNGQQVVWGDAVDGSARLRTVNTSTKSGNTIETVTGTYASIFGTYSPDDQYIYYLRRSSSTTTEIVRRNTDGSNPVVFYTSDSINWLEVR